ncbi:hypothetical protein D0T12_31380 [Actinomadura spongiicola]|uniref:Uncharacterized protein n=1 Tax=Actinomadura spongiicola TaxID=2303421 RepID=A0A372G7T1_9ACTN|nr:hypothetical protein D0T12_31380 [Actinomadura spongiicola]
MATPNPWWVSCAYLVSHCRHRKALVRCITTVCAPDRDGATCAQPHVVFGVGLQPRVGRPAVRLLAQEEVGLDLPDDLDQVAPPVIRTTVSVGAAAVAENQGHDGE